MKPFEFTGEPLRPEKKPRVSFEPRTRSADALLKQLKSRAFRERLKQDLRVLFDTARKQRGVRVDSYRTKDVVEIGKVLLMDNLIRDPLADLSKQCAEARDLLKKSLPVEFKEYSSDTPQDMNYQFTVNPDRLSRDRFPLFKFYCTAKSAYVYQLVVSFVQNFVKHSAEGVRFKVTDYPYLRGKASDKRFIVYAPIDGVAGAVAHALKHVNSDCFHPIAHMYGVDVCKGVRALLVGGKHHEALNERISAGAMTAYQDMLRSESSGEFSENELFELFYANLKQKLMGLPHFKNAFY